MRRDETRKEKKWHSVGKWEGERGKSPLRVELATYLLDDLRESSQGAWS